MRRALLALLLLTLAALAQGCFVGRDLYYVEDPPSKDDQLRAAASSPDGGAGDARGDASSDASPGVPPPPSPPPPVGAGDSETCTPIATPCSKGGGMEYCYTLTGGACSKLVYKHAGKSFACGCGGGPECTNAYYGAYTSCQDAAGACTELASCCKAAQPAYQASCQDTLKTYVDQAYGDVACKSIVTSYRASKICP